ncbi:RloB domain-containing protein [Natronoglycomyces albus]|uniref:RloB domain-containing protein n=1 Tax=Natronoglycomyces albus TaxID=2811108 RepID=A0A895XN76_9ACTN|nr:RloB domain-containing protein [Natronoglycomyces albus]
MTEKQYVERLEQYLRASRFRVSVKSVGVGKDPREVVKKCIEFRKNAKDKDKAFDHCVCLVDVDQHTTLQEAIKTAQREGIDLIVSRLKFEVWLLWHASNSTSVRTTKQLDDLVADHKLLSEKRLSNQFPIDQVFEAVRRARAADPELSSGRVGPDPSSAMPVLVQLMCGEKP